MKEIKSNGLENIISQAIEEMKSEQGDHFLWKRSIWQSWSAVQVYPAPNCVGLRRMALSSSPTGWKDARLLGRF